MKVQDIISEATPGLGTAIKAGVNAFKAARSGAPAVAKTTAKTAPKAATTAAAATKAANPVAQATGNLSWWETLMVKHADKVKGKEVALAKGALKSEVLKSSADDIVKMLTTLQMVKESGV